MLDLRRGEKALCGYPCHFSAHSRSFKTVSFIHAEWTNLSTTFLGSFKDVGQVVVIQKLLIDDVVHPRA